VDLSAANAAFAADIRTGDFRRKTTGVAIVASFPSGFRIVRGYLDRAGQEELAAVIAQVIERAPLYVPRMPRSGRPFSVRMTNCGRLGWVSDETGYRYQAIHPETGQAWPPLPHMIERAWERLADYPLLPEACLINFYAPGTRMGLHQDRDEHDFSAPVVSLSLGDSCLFRIGGSTRKGASEVLQLRSGDVVVLGGAARLAFHGVDRILAGTSDLLPQGGRLNLTLRRVGP
jgi:DNA oxidative demethylase